MNIADLQQDLFEFHIFNDDLYPHCYLINSKINIMQYVQIKILNGYCYTFSTAFRGDDTQTEIIDQLCFYNNKLLLVFYQFCSYLKLNKLLHFTICSNCVKFNYFKTFVWCVNDPNYVTLNMYNGVSSFRLFAIQNIFRHLFVYKRSQFIKWMTNHHNYLLHNYFANYLSYFPYYFSDAITNNNIPIIKWCIATNTLLFDNYHFDRINRTYHNVKITNKMFNILLDYHNLKS